LLDNLPTNLQPGSTLFYYNPQAEDLMLQQAALQQTGKASFIDGLTYDSEHNLFVTAQEKEILYQNAVDYAKANNLQLGDALTQAQLNTLSAPMLWYVEQSVPDPGCVSTGPVGCPTVTALMPQVYLPQNWSAMSADGTITGKDVTLNFHQDGNGSILNTGDITVSNTLAVNTGTLTNHANQVNVGQIWSYINEVGYSETTGTAVQPGGFMSAANMDLNVQTLNQIGGALQQLNADGTVDQSGTQQMLAQLQQQLGTSFTQTTVSDNLHTDFVGARRVWGVSDCRFGLRGCRVDHDSRGGECSHRCHAGSDCRQHVCSGHGHHDGGARQHCLVGCSRRVHIEHRLTADHDGTVELGKRV